MRIKAHFKLREIAGEAIVVNQGASNINLTRIISFNSSARLLFCELEGKEFSMEEAAYILEETYGLEHEQALCDAGKWVEALKQCEVIE